MKPQRSTFHCVEGKDVEFEDGRIERVDSFFVALKLVSIGEFDQFTTETGYVTTAEQRHVEENFRSNRVTNFGGKSSSSEYQQLPALALTLDDAEAYCRWRGARLPTEAEWLALSVMTDRVFDRSEWKPSQEFMREVHRRFGMGAIELGAEWTSSTENGKHIVRFQPTFYRYCDWRQTIDHDRKVVERDYLGKILGFRIVRPSPPSIS